jgi:DNA-binding transcriptional MerR regulator
MAGSVAEKGWNAQHGAIDMKVGMLAKRAGLTVRTLHHYDEIGLVSPSGRTRSGHRMYADADVDRLQRVLSLRQLGLSLEQIGELLEAPGWTLGAVLDEQVKHVRERIRVETELYERLEGISRLLRSVGKVSVEALLDLMEMMMNAENHFTPDQLEYLKQRREQLGDERIQAVENEWPELIARVKQAMDSGVDPASDDVKGMARRWQELVREFTGGDAGVTRSLNAMYEKNLDSSSGHMGIDRAMSEYIGRAMTALGT